MVSKYHKRHVKVGIRWYKCQCNFIAIVVDAHTLHSLFYHPTKSQLSFSLLLFQSCYSSPPPIVVSDFLVVLQFHLGIRFVIFLKILSSWYIFSSKTPSFLLLLMLVLIVVFSIGILSTPPHYLLTLDL